MSTRGSVDKVHRQTTERLQAGLECRAIDLGAVPARVPFMPRFQPTLTSVPWVVDMRVEIAPRFPCVVLNEPVRTNYRSRMLRAHFVYAHRQKPPTDDDIDRLHASGAPEEEIASADASRAAEMTAAFKSKGLMDPAETDALLKALDDALGGGS